MRSVQLSFVWRSLSFVQLRKRGTVAGDDIRHTRQLGAEVLLHVGGLQRQKADSESKQAVRQTDRQRDRETERQTDRQTDRKTDRQTDRQTDRTRTD